MNKLKMFLLVFWGIITVCLLFILLIQRHDAIKNRHKLNVYEKKIAIDYINILDEYGRNMRLIKNCKNCKVNIDSIFQNSDFLKFYNSPKDQNH